MLRRATSILLKLATLAALILALADVPLWSRRVPRRRVYVVDASASVRMAERARDGLSTRDALRIVERDARTLDPDDEAAVVAFAGQARVALPSTRVADFRVPQDVEAPEPDFTRLGPALDLARSLAAPDRSLEIVLMTDGRAMDAPPPTPVVLPVGPARWTAPRIASIRHPIAVRPGESFDIVASFVGEGDATAVFDNEPVEVKLRAGVETRRRWTRRKSADVQRFELTIGDAREEILVSPKAERRRALVLSGHADSPAARALAAGEFDVSRDGSPADFDVVVIEHYAGDLSPLRAHVNVGGGLVALGGPLAYAPGGWAGTPLEEALPVWATPREAATIVFAVDASGSMAQAEKMDVARAQVSAAVKTLGGRDTVVYAAFSDKARVVKSLDDVEPYGPTRLIPALELAARQLRSARTPERHVVLVTDGETQETPDELARAFAALAAEGFGAAVVLTGPIGRAPLLGVIERSLAKVVEADGWESVAEAMRGLFASMRGWTLDAPAATVRREHDVVRGISEIPPPARMNRVELKTGAEEIASAGGQTLGAAWSFGAGRAVAFTTSLEAGWAGAWASWPEAGRLLRQAAAFAAGERGALEPVAWRLEGDALVVEWSGDVTKPGAARFEGPHAGVASVRVVAERGVETRVPEARPGDYTVALDGAARRARVHVSTTFEERRPGIDAEALKRIGAFVAAPDTLGSRFPPARAKASPRLWMAAAALLLFIADIAVGVFWK